MKKAVIIMFVLCIAVSLCACGNKTIESSIDYDIAAVLEENTLTCEQTTTVTNVYADDLTESVFHLLPNTYCQDAVNKAYSGELSRYGGIEISEVTANGVAADVTYTENKEYVTIKHSAAKKGDNLIFTFKYKVTVPASATRLGETEGVYNLSNFYPQLSVYEDGFRTDSFNKIGDNSFSEVASYKVKLTCSTSLVTACGCECTSKTEAGEQQTLVFEGKNVRDFAMVLSSDFNVLNGKAGDVNVYYFYRQDEQAQAKLDLAISAISTYSETFGKYNFTTFSVVATPFDNEGMEYSGLVYVSDKSRVPEETILHETAHQWWYGAVGSDPFNEAYLDEGLTTFSSYYYYLLNGKENEYRACMKSVKRAYATYERLQGVRTEGENASKLNRPTSEFTEYRYTMVEYYKGAMMFDNLLALYGKDKVNALLKEYYANGLNKIVGKEDLIRVSKQKLGNHVEGVLNGWLEGETVSATFAAN